MSHAEILWCIVGMCVVSYVPRVLPPLILARTQMSPFLSRWLKYVPTSVFGALVFSEIFIDGDRLNFSLQNLSLLTSVVVLWVAVKTRSLGKSIVTGIAVFGFLKYVV